MRIRAENKDDLGKIGKLNLEAFETDAEAKLVDALRNSDAQLISLVAEDEDKGEIIGHILFSPVTIEGHTDVNIAGLAPMAVLPDQQNKRIGSELVRKGIETCRESGYDAIVVLEHPKYYPRFGFRPAADVGLGSEYDVPREVFLVLELQQGALESLEGTVQYHPAFKEL